ncbi:conserved hypothetical protein [Thermoanaerobacter mathranii subsp. mathranii str. A3]|uniref:YcxB-like protein domain-containing protein n=1 Tax=Thermoanaerobacter mathranii subsp. mathranii (strain DSM 11426 / CCUG 53645 / CIP 108742 / A3) TaxID=583358 RepID=A0ABN3Z3U0_THEM3|nr:hypothetical protein [Thermoanaerobacter mathranii]ADH61467.1 conserved hypothetical protein [Thermoanaerobacter mathranii subsp. mathranii str. A3]
MDAFIEKLVKRQKTSKDTLFSIGVVVAALIVVFGVIPLIPIVRNLWIFFLFLFAYLAYYLIRSRNIEFEYSLTNSELDVDKIIDQKKRKHVISVDCRDFEVMAKINSDKFTQDIKTIKNRIEAVSSMSSPDVYFAVFEDKGLKTVLFFEPNEKMIEVIARYIPRKLFR